MIKVLAFIQVKPGNRGAFLEILMRNVPVVQAETGCLEYVPAVDENMDLANQKLDENCIAIIETWQDSQTLKAHWKAPHMLSYKEAVKDLVEKVELKILKVL